MDISAVADAIVTRLKTITALQYRASAFGKDYTDPPWAVVVPAPDAFLREVTLGGTAFDATYVIKLIIGAATDRSSQDQLSDYIDTSGSKSIKTAVDGTLGGTVAWATVTNVSNVGDVEWGGMSFNGAEFTVEVGT
ncbi:MAG TPA: hypothetical protein VIS06_03970 [Mycobacteriales bacterium]|jgi:hypothetical protein